MKTYLEYKDEKSQKFWEISVANNEIITRYGKIGTGGKEISKPFESDAIAMYEMHKQILAKREKGYAMPNSISMEALLNHPIIDIGDYFKDNNDIYDLESCYSKVMVIDGNITLNELDLDAQFDANHSTGGFIIKGNLYVNGGIKNDCGDTGLFLIVEGDVIADFVVAGGSQIHLNGESLITSFIVGHYNGGILTVSNTNTICFVNDDHHSEIDGAVKLTFDNYEDEIVPELLQIFSKDEDFFECEDENEDKDSFLKKIVNKFTTKKPDLEENANNEDCYLDIDKFITHLFDDKKDWNY